MNLLLKVLVGGDSSRLHRLLVEEQQSAISVGGFHSEPFDPGVVYFYLTLPPDGDPAAVEASIMAELQSIAADGVTDAELNKARNIMLADFWRELATIDGKASSLGDFEVFYGGYEALFELPDEIEAVSTEDLTAVAAAVFRPTNVTVGVLVPSASEAAE